MSTLEKGGEQPTAQHVPCHYVPGFLDCDVSNKVANRAYDQHIEDFVATFHRVPAQGGDCPLFAFARQSVQGMTRSHEVVQAGNLADPAQPTIYAFTHNIPFLDAAGLLLHLDRTSPERRVAVVSSMRTLERIIPDWRNQNDGRYQVIEVTWTQSEDGRVQITNGAEVLSKSRHALGSGRGAALCIAPEGRRSLLRNGLLRSPHHGLDQLVESTHAVIVPVVTTALRRPFHSCLFERISTVLLDPIPAKTGTRPTEQWFSAVYHFMNNEQHEREEVVH